MPRELLTAIAFSALFPLLLLTVHSFKRLLKLSGETSRKIIHALLGLATLSFPWLFSSPTPVWLIALLTTAILIALRLRRHSGKISAVLHDVERSSIGDICYPVAVALTFFLAHGDPILFCIPMLVLSLADAAGAVVGVSYGKIHYITHDGRKTLEGSLAVGAVAFLAVALPLWAVSPMSLQDSFLLAGIIALIVLAIEAMAFRGLDNLYLPVLVFINLSDMVGAPSDILVARLSVLAILLLSGTILHFRSHLDGGALAASLLACYFIWIQVGWIGTIPVAATALYYVVMTQPVAEGRHHGLLPVLAVTGVGMIWLALARCFDYSVLAAFLVSSGIAAGHVALAGLHQRAWLRPSLLQIVTACVLGMLPVAITTFIISLSFTLSALIFCGISCGIVILEIWQFQRIGVCNNNLRWIRQFSIVVCISLPYLILPTLL